MSAQHLWTARREAWLCRKREHQLLNDAELDRRHRSHAVTAVLSAVAFLELFINAVWEDAGDRKRKPGHHTYYTEGIPDDAMETMRELWIGKDEAERMLSVVSKFQVASVCAGHAPMDRGAEPFDIADVLVRFRNLLVHFKPSWNWLDEDDTKKFRQRLKSKITPALENRQPLPQQSWLADRALGAGCADWACESSIAFARTWHQRMGLTYDFDFIYLTSLPPVEID
jgi:hypothetical protein